MDKLLKVEIEQEEDEEDDGFAPRKLFLSGIESFKPTPAKDEVQIMEIALKIFIQQIHVYNCYSLVYIVLCNRVTCTLSATGMYNSMFVYHYSKTIRLRR